MDPKDLLGKVNAGPSSTMGQAAGLGESRGCGPLPVGPTPVFMQIKRSTLVPTTLLLAEALAHPLHLSLVRA